MGTQRRFLPYWHWTRLLRHSLHEHRGLRACDDIGALDARRQLLGYPRLSAKFHPKGTHDYKGDSHSGDPPDHFVSHQSREPQLKATTVNSNTECIPGSVTASQRSNRNDTFPIIARIGSLSSLNESNVWLFLFQKTDESSNATKCGRRTKCARWRQFLETINLERSWSRK